MDLQLLLLSFYTNSPGARGTPLLLSPSEGVIGLEKLDGFLLNLFFGCFNGGGAWTGAGPGVVRLMPARSPAIGFGVRSVMLPLLEDNDEAVLLVLLLWLWVESSDEEGECLNTLLCWSWPGLCW